VQLIVTFPIKLLKEGVAQSMNVSFSFSIFHFSCLVFLFIV
jgi:hypothetical protein